ncbi:MAG: KEOPS complex kinase/ATPase Bud32, partial [Nanobdellota archaeon]
IIYSVNNKIIKKRVQKGYRHPLIDYELRKTRTIREAKVLQKVPIPTPKLVSLDKENMTIEMEELTGKKLSNHLEKLNYKSICYEIGKNIALMHYKDIIHGDLTTSNIIYTNKLFFIDFGLAFFSTKNEDKAVDLYLLKQALLSRHNKIGRVCFEEVKKSYANVEVLKRLEQVEKRGRHKSKSTPT